MKLVWQSDTDTRPDLTVFLKTAAVTALCAMLSAAQIFSGITPFGAAFYAAIYAVSGWLAPYLALTAVSLLVHQSVSALRYPIAAAIYTLICRIHPIKSRVFRALLMGALLMGVHLAFCAASGLLLYDLVNAFCEGFLCSIALYGMYAALPLLFSAKSGIRARTRISVGELTAVIAIFALACLGLAAIPAAFGVRLSAVLSILLLLMLILKGDPGKSAIAGIVVGTINSVSTYNAGAIIGAYAFSALIACALRRFRKAGVVLGFLLANALITVFLNGSTEALIHLPEILLAGLLLFLLPNELTERFFGFVQKASEDALHADTEKRMQEMVQDKLNEISHAFASLADAYHPESTASKCKRKEAIALFQRASSHACSDCVLKYLCWQKNLHSTYQGMFEMLDFAENNGNLTLDNLPAIFADGCTRPERFLDAFCRQYELYRQQKIWEGRLSECRLLVCEQMKGVSSVMNALSDTVELYPDAEEEERIALALDREGFPKGRVVAACDGASTLTVEWKVADRDYDEHLEYKALPAISKALAADMKVVNVSHLPDGSHLLHYAPFDRFCVAAGVARTQKQGEASCGDQFLTLILPDSTYIAALSDGMGCGKNAEAESRTTLTLLEEFLRAGFPQETALRLINSSLLLRSAGNSFSTMDLCAVNLKNGMLELSKMGAAATYFKSEGKVEEIRVPTLPVGVMREIQLSRTTRFIKEEATVVLLSDGIADTGADWIGALLEKSETHPQEIADSLLSQAILRSGNHACDDMTVLVLRIFLQKNENQQD